MSSLKPHIRNLTLIIFLAALLAFSFPYGGTANYLSSETDASNISLVSHLGENYTIPTLAVQGNYAYISADPELGLNPGLAVLDISDPAHLIQVGFLPLSSRADHIYVSGSYAYAYVGVLQIINISDPTAPTKAGILQGTAVEAVENERAYVHDDGGILRVIDVSNPSAPIELGSYTYNDGDLEVQDSHVYVLETNGLRITDISNPSDPFEVSFYAVSGKQLAVRGEYALITWGYCESNIVWGCERCYGGLRVINISNPSTPVEVTNNDFGRDFEKSWIGSSYAVARTHHCYNIAWYHYESSATMVYDISDLTNPEYIGDIQNPGDVAFPDGLAYLALGTGGLSVWDLSSTNYGELGTYGTQIPVIDVAVSGERAYLVGETLQVVDVSDPKNPALVDEMDLPGTGKRIKLSGNHAYIAADNLLIVDISDPAATFEVSSLDSAYDVAFQGNYAYLASGSLNVMDVSNPANPSQVGSAGISGSARAVAVQDEYAYVGRWDIETCMGKCSYTYGGLSVFDISDPTAPVEVGNYIEDYFDNDRLNEVNAVAVAGNYAYVADGALNVIDISDPTEPSLVNNIYSGAEDVFIAGHPAQESGSGYLYVALGNQGFQVMDISNPTSPASIGYYDDMPGFASRSASLKDYIYVADGNWGLIILRFGYSVAGQVLQANGLPFPGAPILASEWMTATTDINGDYRFVGLQQGTHTLTSALSEYTFRPLSRTVTVPPDAVGQNFTILPKSVSTTLTPGISTTLTYTDTQGLPTHLEFPPEAVTSNTNVVLTPTIATDETGIAFAGHAFELAVSAGGSEMSSFVFNSPVTVIIHYSAADTRVLSDINKLFLWLWKQNAWQDAAHTCGPSSEYSRDNENRTIRVAICEAGYYGLFGPTNQLFLPIVLK